MNKHGGYYGDNDIIDFSVNINPFGYPKGIESYIIKTLKEINKYPEIDGVTSKKYIANNLGVNHENIIIGNGAIELIYLYAKLFINKDIVVIQPTFNEYQRAFAPYNCRLINYITMEEEEFKINASKLMSFLKEIKPDLVILCNPNNPTGSFMPYEEMLEIFKYSKEENISWLIDESFIDFTDKESAIKYISEYPLFIVHSLTKFFGVPGLRIGYGIASKEVINKLHKYKEPWSLNSFALNLLPVIINDYDYIAKTKRWINKERKYLFDSLSAIKDISVFETKTNFFLCKYLLSSTIELQDKLLQKGIYIRTCEDFVGLGNNYFRIAIKSREDNDKLIEILKEI